MKIRYIKKLIKKLIKIYDYKNYDNIQNHPENRLLTLKEQRNILDFITTELYKINIKIYWTNNIHSWHCNYREKVIYIPKPITVCYTLVALHELGHYKQYQILNYPYYNHNGYRTIEAIQAEQFADTYAFQLLNHFNIKWYKILWLNRLQNIKNYESWLTPASNYPLTNFYIKPLHLLLY